LIEEKSKKKYLERMLQQITIQINETTPDKNAIKDIHLEHHLR
jgi:hypothetical protein